MSERAAVDTFDALKRFRVVLCRVADALGAATEEVDAELRRESEWLRSVQTKHWKNEAIKRAELLTRAKAALAQKRWQSGAMGSQSTCIDEKNEVARAEQRLEEAERKQANVRRWLNRLDREIHAYAAVAGRLSEARTKDIANAVGLLDNMLDALEAYAGTVRRDHERSTPAADSVSLPPEQPGNRPESDQNERQESP